MLEHPIQIIFLIIYLSGFFTGCMAILTARTPQGATAWVMSLITIPMIAVPLYFIFGRSKFSGYNNQRRIMDMKVFGTLSALKAIDSSHLSVADEMKLINSTISSQNQPGFTRGNKIKLLVNAAEAYSSMIEEMAKAKKYIIIQFYIFRYDEIGKKITDLLIRKAREGVKISFLHDAIGNDINTEMFQKMSEAGILIGPFNTQSITGKMQVNFRNHRKIIIVDGKVGFVGGLNIGDDYLGRSPKWGNWRDTHVRFEGPSVLCAQLASAKDWYFTKEEQINSDWELHPTDQDENLLILHTGPADRRHTCLLAHIALINSATKRLWISNPYFVPPESLMDAILLAILRGVDVRVILPSYSDARTIMWASKVYQERLIDHGATIYRFTQGFLHQKVMLIDDCFGVVGSTNLDCRSMFINFEITAISSAPEFIKDMELMLQNDFKNSVIVHKSEFVNASLISKILSRGANLMAPVL